MGALRSALVVGGTGEIGSAIADALGEICHPVAATGSQHNPGISAAWAAQADVLVNCAGITDRKALEDITVDDVRRMMRVKLELPLLCIQAALPRMKERGWGRIINIASVAALTGGRYQGHYAWANAALTNLTKTYALDAGPGVTVNAIAPGIVGPTEAVREEWELDAVQKKNAALPVPGPVGVDEVAAAVRYLVSDGARHVTGQTLHINGGAVMP